jgi:CheY-like chemotaxis protein
MKPHILLVDDDKDELLIFLDALREVPEEDGFKCSYANSAEKALEMLKFLVPDFIFLDFNLPGMNGLQLLSYINTQLDLKHTPVYMYSNKITDAIRQSAKLLGADGCIAKADSIHALRNELESVLVSRSLSISEIPEGQ